MYERILLKNLHLKDVNPRICGIRDCEPGQIIGSHRLEDYVLHYVIKGRGYMQIGNAKHTASAGQIFVVRPGESATYVADIQEPWSYIWVSFECDAPFAQLFAAPILTAPWAASIFSRIYQAGQMEAREWAICGLLYELFAGLYPQHVPVSEKEDYIHRAVNYIQSNYAENIAVAELASNLGLSRNYFCRLFRTQMGVPPQEYLVAYRLEKAAEMLTVQGMSQKRVANLVGYPDVYAFSRMFRRRFFMPPGEYVRQYQEKQQNAEIANI